MTLELTAETFDDFVTQSEKPVVIDFYADWCGPCKRMSPILEQIASERDDITLVKVDVDAVRTATGKFGIMAMPTFIILYAGAEIARSTGARPKETLNTWIDEAIAKLGQL